MAGGVWFCVSTHSFMDCLIAKRQLFKLRLHTHGCNLQSSGDDEASWESPSTPLRQSRLRQLNCISHSTKAWWANCAAFLQQREYVCFMANKYTGQFEMGAKMSSSKGVHCGEKNFPCSFPVLWFSFLWGWRSWVVDSASCELWVLCRWW